MKPSFSSSDLEAYLDEAWPADEMARVEMALRTSPELLRQLALIHGRRDAGVHTLGEIWRRHRLGCPGREQLGSFLLGAISAEHASFIRLHVEEVGCRWCQSNLADLARLKEAGGSEAVQRRRRYFESSAGCLRKN